MTSLVVINLVIALAVIVICAAAWRRRGGRPIPRRAQVAMLVVLIVLAAVLAYLAYVGTPAR